jgi:hypothetical protein
MAQSLRTPCSQVICHFTRQGGGCGLLGEHLNQTHLFEVILNIEVPSLRKKEKLFCVAFKASKVAQITYVS